MGMKLWAWEKSTGMRRGWENARVWDGEIYFAVSLSSCDHMFSFILPAKIPSEYCTEIDVPVNS